MRVKCEYCGKEFETNNSCKKKKYCSNACAVAVERSKRFEKKICPNCGEMFYTSVGAQLCFFCRNPNSKRKRKPAPEIPSKPKYDIRDICAIEKAVNEKTHGYYGYSDIVNLLQQGKIYVDKISTVDGIRTAEIFISGLI